MKLSIANSLQKYLILSQIIVSFQVTEANYLRSFFFGDKQQNDKSIQRELDWNFANVEFEDDRFFNSYDPDEIPEDKTKPGDRIDYLRDGDVCVGDDGSLAREHCLEPPECSHSSEEIGQAMLCINRASVPGNTTSWYVLAMKCIPLWENCDKCYCGYMKRSYAEDGFCRWDDSSANDDRVEYDCDDRSRAEMMGRSYTFGEPLPIDGTGNKDEKNDKGGGDKGGKDKGGEDEDEDADYYGDAEYEEEP